MRCDRLSMRAIGSIWRQFHLRGLLQCLYGATTRHGSPRSWCSVSATVGRGCWWSKTTGISPGPRSLRRWFAFHGAAARSRLTRKRLFYRQGFERKWQRCCENGKQRNAV